MPLARGMAKWYTEDIPRQRREAVQLSLPYQPPEDLSPYCPPKGGNRREKGTLPGVERSKSCEKPEFGGKAMVKDEAELRRLIGKISPFTARPTETPRLFWGRNSAIPTRPSPSGSGAKGCRMCTSSARSRTSTASPWATSSGRPSGAAPQSLSAPLHFHPLGGVDLCHCHGAALCLRNRRGELQHLAVFALCRCHFSAAGFHILRAVVEPDLEAGLLFSAGLDRRTDGVFVGTGTAGGESVFDLRCAGGVRSVLLPVSSGASSGGGAGRRGEPGGKGARK